MKDGSDAVGDWAVLNALINTAAGGSWISFHHGGGVGMGYSLHAGIVVADGSERAERRLERVLTTDPGMGVADMLMLAMTSLFKQLKKKVFIFQ